MIIVKAVRQSPVDPVQTVAPVRDASYLAERQLTSISIVLSSSFLKWCRPVSGCLSHQACRSPALSLVDSFLQCMFTKNIFCIK
jgi:hypothetical protein